MDSLESNGAPTSLVIPPSSPLTYKGTVQTRPKGHYRSSSLENNPFYPNGKTNLSIAQANFTGTLKSRREQKRISDFLSKQTLSTAKDGPTTESSIRKAHFENIREIFEKNNSKNAAAQHQQQHQQHQLHQHQKPKHGGSVLDVSNGGGSSSTLGIPIDEKPPKIQACSGILGKGKQVIRPIAFKPVPYKCNTPNYGGRLTDLGDRYGSTPSLGPPMNLQYKFGSSTDLHQHLACGASAGAGGGTTPANVGGGPCLPNGVPVSGIGHVMSNSYHQQYSTMSRKGSTIPFKTYDSLESILKLPDSMVASYPAPGNSQSNSLYTQQDLLDMAPSPSDSGISELEAALRDRDSELAYLRQTMEHNEQVIFKVHQDKEKHWEQELNRLKAIHESRLRAGAQKVHKLEQLLMMQTFQLRQDKKRLQEDISRLHADIALTKEQTEHQKAELCHLKLSEKDLKDQNGDLVDEIQMLRRVISDLKERLEESEWNLCQKNGEMALMKTQLKDAQSDLASKDQEIVQLKADVKLQNFDEISMKKSEIKKELDFDLEISQLNRIIIFKDQIIVLMNNEIQKLRKELSDISILRGYEGAPPGRYARYKKKLELAAQKFEENERNDSNNNNNNNNNGTNNTTNTTDNDGQDMVPEKKSINSNEIIRNYFNSKLEINKKLFLSAQISNYSDEDKSTIIETYGSGKGGTGDGVTLDLSSLLPKEVTSVAITDCYHHQSSSDDDYKSMTPTRDQDEDEDDEEDRQQPSTKTKDSDATVISVELERLNRELVSCREVFEQERQKWADEKEKVLIYQRQLQQNYVDMCKRTHQLEEKLHRFEDRDTEAGTTTQQACR